MEKKMMSSKCQNAIRYENVNTRITNYDIAPRLITDNSIENPYVHEFIESGFKL